MSLIDDTYALISTSSRSIGSIVPHVTVEEVHRDDLVITDHPVEKGADISDHAFKLPQRVQMRVGWSDSTAAETDYVKTVYAELLALQAQREPFDVSTGKRAYSNMLIESLAVTTDETTENALMVVCGLREVIITSTSSTSSSGLGSQGSQASPASTASDVSTGTKQAVAQASFPPTGV